MGAWRVTRFLVGSLLATLLVAACGGDSPSMGEPGSGGGGGGGVGGSGNEGAGGSLGCDQVLAPGGELGGPCRDGATQCNTGFVCIPELPDPLGGPADPIMSYPPGQNEAIDRTAFVGSYCTLPFDVEVGCDAEACFDQCGFCSREWGVCMNACQPELGTNGTCWPGYQCDLLDFVCSPGCTTDDECRVSRQGDALVYNASSGAVCNPQTYRCEHPGTSGAEAGIPCTFDDDCEANGVCLNGTDGYCSKFGCDVTGNGCEGDGVCAFGVCAAPCEVGSDDVTEWEINTQGCRPGYTCYWARGDADPSGYCDLGLFNPGISNNIGSACETNEQCYSPFGYGGCDPDFGCTVYECGVPGMPADVCGENATCVDFINLEIDLFACLKKCADAGDCPLGHACADLDGPATPDDLVCFPVCLDSAECRDGEVCDVNHQCVAP
jgi:hypothetical protein